MSAKRSPAHDGAAGRTTPTASAVPARQLAQYTKLVSSVPDLELKVNFGSAYTAINGNMFSMISKHGVVGIRLPEPERSQFMQKYDTTVFRADPSWPPAKEYVAVPEALLPKTATLRPYLEHSAAYARSLKPKRAKKPPAE